MNPETSFKQAYGILTRHAETLRDQDEPNIDDLLKIVTESVDAYQVCKSRIDAVEMALEQALSGSGGDAGGSSTPRATPAGPQASEDDADDIPF